MLVDEALAVYDHVLVEIGPLLASPTGGGVADRFAAGRVMAARAERAVVLASGDPEGAARLVEWRATAAEMDGPAAVWAVFGRVPGRGPFERSHLGGILEASTRPAGFVGVHYLPGGPGGGPSPVER